MITKLFHSRNTENKCKVVIPRWHPSQYLFLYRFPVVALDIYSQLPRWGTSGG